MGKCVSEMESSRLLEQLILKNDFNNKREDDFQRILFLLNNA